MSTSFLVLRAPAPHRDAQSCLKQKPWRRKPHGCGPAWTSAGTLSCKGQKSKWHQGENTDQWMSQKEGKTGKGETQYLLWELLVPFPLWYHKLHTCAWGKALEKNENVKRYKVICLGSCSRAPGKSDPWTADFQRKSISCEVVGLHTWEKAGADKF